MAAGRVAARKSKRITKFLNLSASHKRSLYETISSFAYLFGGRVSRGKKEESFLSNLSLSIRSTLSDRM
jgi:hypothetical protein